MVFVIVTCLKQYVDFCKTNNLTVDNFNYFSTITGVETVGKYVDKTALENRYITYEQLIEMEDLCINPQDAVIPELLFNGVKGERAIEILELEKENIKEDRIVLEDREIPISTRTYQLIMEAYEQKEYLKGNGDYDGYSPKMFLPDGSNILRSSGTVNHGKLGYQALAARVTRIKEYFGNPYINITNIWISGMIHLAKQIKEEKGDLTKEDWIKISKQFGYPEQHWSQTKLRIERLL
jgi:hypothetical protein